MKWEKSHRTCLRKRCAAPGKLSSGDIKAQGISPPCLLLVSFPVQVRHRYMYPHTRTSVHDSNWPSDQPRESCAFHQHPQKHHRRSHQQACSSSSPLAEQVCRSLLKHGHPSLCRWPGTPRYWPLRCYHTLRVYYMYQYLQTLTSSGLSRGVSSCSSAGSF